MLTIFTPTYNREKFLLKLYYSLCQQTHKNFEWLIVDDGSVDKTREQVDIFILENIINIRYIYQENSGKHVAINKGVKEAKGNFFFIVDSDDYLYDNSVEIIFNHLDEISKISNIAGICALKTTFDGHTIGGNVTYKKHIANLLDYRYVQKIAGDKAEVFKISVLRQFPFPETIGEKFCPEALIWNRISKSYDFLFINEKIYKCEYLSEGLTSNIFKIRANSPYNAMLTYSELSKCKIPFLMQMKSMINFWRFAFYEKKHSFHKKIIMIPSVFTIIAIPLGYILYLLEKKKAKV
jgi:glycosyltransferase involved in cell wall biosynthesis